MDTENEEKSLRDEIVSAVAESKEPVADTVDVPEIVETPEAKEGRDDKGRFKGKEAVAEVAAPVDVAAVKAPEIEAPASLTGAIKAKWKDLPEDVRQEWSKREADMTKAMTSQDGDLRLGREIKDVVMPYMPIIQAEGGTPATAVRDLLNTAYQLRTGTPEQKTKLLHDVAKQYGVDLGQPQEQQYADPTIQQLQQEIAQLKQSSNPETIHRQLQERVEHDKIVNEVKAFSSDPANKHYERVKAAMAPLLGNGVAKDMKEAYDMACWADPAIRSTLLAEQTTTADAKRKADMDAKKKAASSITGSPGITVPNSGAPDRSLRDELRANLRAAQ